VNVLSLFDGISGGQLALKRAGVPVETYYASEIEKASIQVTQHNFPDTVQLGSVDTVTGLNGIDLLIGGSPCQSFSRTISGNIGFDGKSKLFFEYLRLLKETNPKYFFLENVVMKKEWEDVITEYLGVEPILINSSHFSAQSRDRLYWTNIPVPELPEPSPLLLRDILERSVDEKYFYDQSYTLTESGGAVEAILDINGHDILKRVNSKDHKCQTLTAVCGGNQQKKVIDNGRVRKLTPVEYERLQTVPDNYTANVSNGARYKALGNGWTVDVVSHIFKGLTTD
jgi:site-specific DNA-cytosine methylase